MTVWSDRTTVLNFNLLQMPRSFSITCTEPTSTWNASNCWDDIASEQMHHFFEKKGAVWPLLTLLLSALRLSYAVSCAMSEGSALFARWLANPQWSKLDGARRIAPEWARKLRSKKLGAVFFRFSLHKLVMFFFCIEIHLKKFSGFSARLPENQCVNFQRNDGLKTNCSYWQEG